MRIDWTVPQHCIVCDKRMRPKRGPYIEESVVYSGKGVCKNCDRVRYLEENSEARVRKNLIRKNSFYSKYSMTTDDYEAMLLAQNYKCAVCSVHRDDLSKPLYVDHDHSCCPGTSSCGECVRGLLCVNCNFALGHLKDDIETLKKLLDYLVHHS